MRFLCSLYLSSTGSACELHIMYVTLAGWLQHWIFRPQGIENEHFLFTTKEVGNCVTETSCCMIDYIRPSNSFKDNKLMEDLTCLCSLEFLFKNFYLVITKLCSSFKTCITFPILFVTLLSVKLLWYMFVCTHCGRWIDNEKWNIKRP